MDAREERWGRYPPRLDEVVEGLERRLEGGASLWVYGSARLGLRAVELSSPPGDVVKVGLNAALNGIRDLALVLAVDYSALFSITSHTVQPGMTFLFPRHPEVLGPGSRVGRPLPAYDARHPLPTAAVESARRERWDVRLFDYRRLGNPGGGSYYYSVKPHPKGFFTFRDGAGRPVVINGFAHLSTRQREQAARRIALHLNGNRDIAEGRALNGLLAGRSLFPLMDLLLRSFAEEIHMAGFSDENPDYRMTNLVAARWAEMHGKRLLFHLPDADGTYAITGDGFKVIASATPTPARASPPAPAVADGAAETLHVVIPFFDGGEPALIAAPSSIDKRGVVTEAGYPAAVTPNLSVNSAATSITSAEETVAIRAENLRRTLMLMDRAARSTPFRITLVLVEVTSGENELALPAITMPVERLRLESSGGQCFPKQFLFACALERVRRRHGDEAIVLLHDADVPISDPGFFLRVVNGLREKRFLHNVTKGIYLTPELSEAVTGQLLDEGGDVDPMILESLRQGVLANRLSNEVSRYLFSSSRRLAGLERLAPQMGERLLWRLPPGDRVAVDYLGRIQRHYHGRHHVNFHFPGLSWAGRVGHLQEAIWPSALFTGWGFEDSTLMESARKLWGDGERHDGVGCIIGPSGLVSRGGVPLGDAFHQYHPVSGGMPWWSAKGDAELHARLFAFELKKAVQLRFVESADYDARWISWLSWMARAGEGGRLVEQALEEGVLPSFDMVEELTRLFDFLRPGEPRALNLDALLAYYDYWRARGEPWRLYDRPGGGHGREGALFSGDFAFRHWADQRGIRPADLMLTITPRISRGGAWARVA